MTDKENQGYPELQNMQIWGQSKTWALLPCPTKFQKSHVHCLCDTKNCLEQVLIWECTIHSFPEEVYF